MYKKLKLVESAKLTEAKVTDYVSEDELAELIKNNSILNVVNDFRVLDDMYIEITTDMGKSIYKVVKNDDGKLEAYWSDKDGKALGDSFVLKESVNLTEADEEELEDRIDDLEDTIETNDDLQDTVDSEEEQDENPVEEESELDTKLDELREILVDLDLNLYRIASKEDSNNVIYIIGKVAEDSNDTLMLIDTKPEDVNKEEIEEPIINNIEEPEKDIEEGSSESEEVIEEPSEEEVKSELESRFDFIVLPKSFEEINKLNPRYGEDITPDHEAIIEYLMNCLIEINPEAAEELQSKDLEIADEIPAEPVEDLELDIGIEGEEELEDEE